MRSNITLTLTSAGLTLSRLTSQLRQIIDGGLSHAESVGKYEGSMEAPMRSYDSTISIVCYHYQYAQLWIGGLMPVCM